MTTGATQRILVCVPLSDGDGTTLLDQQVCPPLGGQQFRLESQGAFLLAPETSAYIDSIAQPFDYGMATAFWGFAFTTVLTLWLVAFGVGSVIHLIRRT